MKARNASGWYRIVSGKCIGDFSPRQRAELETRARVLGVSFDEFMVKDMFLLDDPRVATTI